MDPGTNQPFYFANKPEYHQLLEELANGGQAKGRVQELFSLNPEDHLWHLKERDDLARVISKKPYARKWPQSEIKELAHYVLIMCYFHKLSLPIVLSLIEVESSFNPAAISNRGARGMMQIMPETGEYLAKKIGVKWMGEASLHDPKLNIAMALQYLVELRAKFKRTDLILTAYNMGPYALKKKLDNGEEPTFLFYKKVKDGASQYKDPAKAKVVSYMSWSALWL